MGLIDETPHALAGSRNEPPVSLPIDNGTNRAARAAALPPDEPPGENSVFARELLGDLIVDGTLAVRRYEQRTYGGAAPDDLTAAFRMAFSC